MNEKRRKRLQTAIARLDQARDIVQECGEEEREAHDSLPESLQWNERGERMEEAASKMEEAVSLIDDAIELVSDSSE